MSTRKLNLINLAVALALLVPGATSLPPDAVMAPDSRNQEPLLSGKSGLSPAAVNPAPALKPDFGQLPLYFVENRGQTDPRVAYYIQGRDKTLYFTSEGVTFALTSRPKSETSDSGERAESHVSRRGPTSDFQPPTSNVQRWTVKLDFVGANPNVHPVGQSPTEAVISYFKGMPDQWHTGLPTYARLVYPELWPGIDLVYYGTFNQLKYEFVVKPGADLKQIRLAYRGATSVQVNADGQLEVTTPLGGFHDDTPVAYQDVDGRRVGVAIAYALDEGRDDPADRLLAGAGDTPVGAGDAPLGRLYSFRVGDYDPTRPLVLDPAVLVYAGYIGGDGHDKGHDITVDSAGNAYVTGYTSSGESSFPEMVGPDLTYNGGGDAFVAKVNTAGTGLAYVGYIGGNGTDVGFGIVVDQIGNAYVTGHTGSTEASFPVTVGPDLTYNGGSSAAFVAKVNAAGTALIYAGYIGGNGQDVGRDIAVDQAGNTYVTGEVQSTEATFPVTVGPDLTYNGGVRDAFVAKVNAAGTALVYAGYIGGSGEDNGWDITVDEVGNAYIAGWTKSNDLPVTVGPDLTYNGGIEDAFVAKVNAAGTALVYAGYVGGSGDDRAVGIKVDPLTGAAYIAGFTGSTEASFPVAVGPDLTYNGGSFDAFVAEVNASGSALVYAGYIGGSGEDQAWDMAVDQVGDVYITGYTDSTEASFPVTIGPDLTYNGGVRDAFVAKFDATSRALVYTGYIGGNGEDWGWGIAVDQTGDAYITGYTDSTEASFPVTGGPDLSYNGGNLDGFVAKVESMAVYTSITLTAESGYVSVQLAWNSTNDPTVLEYRVSRAISGTSLIWLPIATVSNTIYFDANGVPGAAYCYQVEALRQGGSAAVTSNAACATLGRVDLWVPSVWAKPGEMAIIPVNIRNANGLQIASSDIWLDFDASVIEPLTISRTALTEGYAWSYSIASTQTYSRTRISAIASPPPTLYGDGSLFWLTVRVRGAVGMTTTLDLREFIAGVGGSTIYTPDDPYHPIPLFLDDGVFHVGANYILGDLNGNGVVEAIDAWIALQIASGQFNPTWEQQQAGDVNGNGVVDAADATMILYYAAHGYWPAPGSGSLQLTEYAPQANPVLSLDSVSGAPGATVETTLRAANLSGWAGSDFAIAYDQRLVSEIIAVEATELATGFALSFHDDGQGLLRIALAKGAETSGSGAIATLRMRLAPGAPVGASAPLALAEARLNDIAGRDFATSALQLTVERQNGQTTISQQRLYLPLVQK